MEEKIFTEESMKRYSVLEEVIKKRLSVKEASMLLDLSYRHTLRLKKRYNREGIESLKFSKTGRKPKISREEREYLISLYFQRYEGRLNIMHFKDILKRDHGFDKYSYESIRKIILSTGLKKVKKRKIKHRCKRQRMPKEGMLVQMDSSYHHWLENIPEKWYLIAMIDDASGKLYSGGFYDKDTVFNNMEVIKIWIKKKGIFIALYTDKASHFTTTRHAGIHYDISDEHDDTQIEQALGELSITLITADSPQAKGRVERLFKTLQDRLINELHIYNIKDYDEANHYLKHHFIPDYNKKFGLKRVKNNHIAVPKDINLDLVFTKRYTRRVRNDFTISFMGETIQLPPSKHKLSLKKVYVDLRLNSKRELFIFYKNNLIHKVNLSQSSKIVKKQLVVDSLLAQRSYQNV